MSIVVMEITVLAQKFRHQSRYAIFLADLPQAKFVVHCGRSPIYR